jgi:hypothetical protein
MQKDNHGKTILKNSQGRTTITVYPVKENQDLTAILICLGKDIHGRKAKTAHQPGKKRAIAGQQ